MGFWDLSHCSGMNFSGCEGFSLFKRFSERDVLFLFYSKHVLVLFMVLHVGK